MNSKEVTKFMDRMSKARKAITDRHGTKKPFADIHARMACPVCEKGTLYYQISSYNGHIHAKCSTKDCVGWME